MSDRFAPPPIPDDPAHWDALAERVAAAAAREANQGGFDWFARSRTGWVAASLLLAAALAFLERQSEDPSAETLSAVWTQALAPVDAVGRAIVVRDGPPAIGTLLLSGQSGSVR